MNFEEFSNEICSEDKTTVCGLLREALFYYCAGLDPTPIAALFTEYPLFVYSDLLKRGGLNLEESVCRLENRLIIRGFVCKKRAKIEMCEGALLGEWEKDGTNFLLLYVKGESWQTYSSIYGRDGELMPKCIANIKYEMDTKNFLSVEREVRFVLGHSYSGLHRAARKFEYLGDYSGKDVTPFERGE